VGGLVSEELDCPKREKLWRLY